MEKNDKAVALLGLATRAGKTLAGEVQVMEAIRKRKAALVIAASDASDNTRKAVADKCGYYGIPVLIYADKDSLGRYTGRGYTAIAAVTDRGFAAKIGKLIEENNNRMS